MELRALSPIFDLQVQDLYRSEVGWVLTFQALEVQEGAYSDRGEVAEWEVW
jgi:hypothetical protein